jgi:hypothetical protein
MAFEESALRAPQKSATGRAKLQLGSKSGEQSERQLDF